MHCVWTLTYELATAMEETEIHAARWCAVKVQALGLATVCHFSQLLPLLLEWLAASDAETCLLAAQVCISAIGRLLSGQSFKNCCSCICTHHALPTICKRLHIWAMLDKGEDLRCPGQCDESSKQLWGLTLSNKSKSVESSASAAMVQALKVVLRQTWPRVPAHAQTLWDHLAEQHQAAVASEVPRLSPGREHESFNMSEQRDDGDYTEDTEEDAKMHSMQLKAKSESDEELAKTIVEAAEILWWAGGAAFREHLQQASSEVSKRLLRKLPCIQT